MGYTGIDLLSHGKIEPRTEHATMVTLPDELLEAAMEELELTPAFKTL